MQPGQRIGKYVLGEKIAVGGMAEVWAARAEGPEGFVKPVALKFILESFSGDPELERLFFKEARIAAQLQHANLVSVFDFDKVVGDPERGHGGRYYIAMEHVEGHDARRVVEAAKHAGYLFPLPLALYLVGEVLKGLRYVHERREKGRPLGLVHRDVSPHNVLVGFSGEVKLSDFGIAKSLAHSTRTKTGTIRGKLSYASPEQLNGEPVDHRADQFALGITLWEILAGRPLFDGNDEIEIVGKVMRCDVPALSLVCPERKFPPEVEAAVRKMLSPARDRRFASTADALSTLLALPGYSADGVALGELVRTLFHRSAGPVSTMSLLDPRARAGPAAARWQPRGNDRVAPGPMAGEPRPSEVETRTMARPPVSPARSSRGWPAPGHRTAPTTEPSPATLGWRRWAVAAVVVAAAGVAIVAIVAAVTHGRGAGDAAEAPSIAVSAAASAPSAASAASTPEPPSPGETRVLGAEIPPPSASQATPTPGPKAEPAPARALTPAQRPAAPEPAFVTAPALSPAPRPAPALAVARGVLANPGAAPASHPAAGSISLSEVAGASRPPYPTLNLPAPSVRAAPAVPVAGSPLPSAVPAPPAAPAPPVPEHPGAQPATPGGRSSANGSPIVE